MAQTRSVAELAEFLGAVFQGDGQHQVSSLADLERAESDQLSFLAKKQFEKHLATTAAGLVIVREDCPAPEHLNIIRVSDPYLAYARVSSLFVQRQRHEGGVHPSAVVSASASVSPGAWIGPGCVLEDDVFIGADAVLQAGVFIGKGSVVGSGCFLYANSTVYHGVTLGERVIIHAAATVGSDGFGFAPSAEGWVKIHQLGGVRIGNDTEIGAGTTIDRGAIDHTQIGNGVIIDNQVHIAHNCVIGDYTAIAGCVGIAGSTTIGKHCAIGGGVGINGHISIADNVHINGGSVITSSISESGHYASGTPFQSVKQWRKNAVRAGQLNDWVERIKKLEQKQSES